MERNVISEINNGLQTAFFECNTDSNLAYRPQFITNDHKRGIKVLTHIENQLMHCDEFSISVAFISRSGFVELSETLKELERRGIKGRILTTDYLHFSDPYALDRLAALKNVELKMYHVDEAGVGFHTKGYLFRENGIYRIIIGSSNMTQTALSTNMEWNTQLVSTEQGEMAQSIVKEFEMLWTDDVSYTYEEFSEVYRKEYKHKKQIDRLVREQQKIALQEEIIDYDAYKLKPNKMQEEFICSVHDLIERGAKKALLISATGTGKTYASAFAMRNEKPKKALFIVHRELIARQALKSYKKVFGSTKKLALLSGNSKEYDADILFATMSMMAKTETLERYKVDEFDWICIDEVHRAGSESYQKIMNYFQPDFWLGMTASPERTDGFDIFNLFDHNIAYEIRLQHALKEDLLCPFHYFGITDIEIDGETVDDKTDLRNFSYLVSDTRARYILEQANYFGHSGERVKGLIFCSGKKEAQELSTKFNEYGYYTTVLTGANSEKEREKAINLLTREVSTDEIEKHEKDICNHVKNDTDEMPFLDYIFTIDIFNEGVDIPEINQVLMLRPTESPIVFVQQLGRGLRKAEGKEYVVIIDFIGNYTNNYMIPIALSGDRSYNKDSIRRYVSEGTRIIPGASTIHFDEISRKRIFQSIDSARTNDVKLLRESFEQLKYRLGRIPSILDFRKYGSIDVNKYFVKFDSYYAFLVKSDKYYGELRSVFVAYLNTLNRLKISNPADLISRKAAKTHPIHYVAFEQKYRQWISANFKKAFGEELIPFTQNGNNIPLCIGKQVKFNDEEFSDEQTRQEAYEKVLETYKQVQDQGDGIKSFTGILLYLMLDYYSIFLIDEPESFLHPPQANIMGRIIGETLSDNQQAFISTHSEEIIKGLLEVCPERVKVIRITRVKDNNSFSILENKKFRFSDIR